MKFFPGKANLLKLSGVNSILGIDLYKGIVRVAELSARGGFLNRYRSEYRASAHFSLNLAEALSPSERGQRLAEAMKANGIRARFCVSSIRTVNSRTVIADIPMDISQDSSGNGIRSWINDNYEKLIRVPIQLSELTFDYDILSAGPDSVKCEIAFVRTKEIEEWTGMLNSAGLHVLNLGLDVRNFEFGIQADSQITSGDNVFIFVDSNDYWCTLFPPRKKTEELQPITRKKLRFRDLDEALLSLQAEFPNLGKCIVTGPGASGGSSATVWSPLGLPPEYALSVSLAVHGFLFSDSLGENTKTLDFRPEDVRRAATMERDKGILKYGTLVMGMILFILLSIQFGIQSHLQKISDGLDARLAKASHVYSQVNQLRRQIDVLKTQIDGDNSAGHRSHAARVLHEIAVATPGGVWLYRMTLNQRNLSDQSLELWGYAETNRDAAAYLASLQQDRRFTNVRVVRVGAPTPLEAVSFPSERINNFVTFDVKLGTIN